jgi:hypothetical protein
LSFGLKKTERIIGKIKIICFKNEVSFVNNKVKEYFKGDKELKRTKR